MNLKVLNRFLVSGIVALSPRAGSAEEDAPWVRGPGVSQETLEALAEGQGKTLLSDALDLKRPGEDFTNKLTRSVERAQSSWLSGATDSARAIFKDIAKMALEADWRDPQREAIQYAMVRLAQSAPTATERADWIERAVSTFPDLRPDSDSFPPPLMQNFHSSRSRILALAQVFRPFEHFSEYRYLLINGKRFAITPELKLRLPKGRFRVTVLSDLYGALSEVMTTSQLLVFRLAAPPLASGTCSDPASRELPSGLTGVTVVYTPDCLRRRNRQGWLAQEEGLGDFKRTPFAQRLDDPFPNLPERPEVSSHSKTWVWVGLTALAIGAGYFAHREVNRDGEWELAF